MWPRKVYGAFLSTRIRRFSSSIINDPQTISRILDQQQGILKILSNQERTRRIRNRILSVPILGVIVGLGILWKRIYDALIIPNEFILRVNFHELFEDVGLVQLISRGKTKDMRVFMLLESIRIAAEDPRCKALVTVGDREALQGLSIADMEDIGNMIRYFSDKKRKLSQVEGRDGNSSSFIYWDSIQSAPQLALSLAYDECSVHPLGFQYAELPQPKLIHFKDLLDKLGVKWQVSKNGKYKSFMEMFTESEPTAFNLEQNKKIHEDFERTYLQQINRFIERKGEHLLKPLETWDSAIVSKLVHSSCSLTDFHHNVRTRFDPSKYPIVKWKDYSGIITGRESQKKYNGNIGVLFIEGKILDGQKPSSFSISQQRGESSYSFDVIRLLKKAYNDDSLDAVLLLVNSPGGSATAAAMILEELEKLNKKKPVYVRMTEVAASGGYMISLASNKIICNESTLTGSIGALAGKPVIRELLEKLGISIHNITSGLDTSLNDISKEWTEKEFALVSEQSERVYTEFKNYVARHRNLSLDQVDQLAEGRIWTGLSAKQGGLVDDTGGHLSIVAFLKDLIQGKNQKQTTSPISNEEISLEFKSLHSPISSIAQLLFKGDDSADPNKSDSMI